MHDEGPLLVLAGAGSGAVLARSWLGATYAHCGDAARARRQLDELHALERTRYVDPVSIADIQASLGDVEGALRSFEKAFQDRTPNMVHAALGNRLFPATASQPRYRAILQRMGFPKPDN